MRTRYISVDEVESIRAHLSEHHFLVLWLVCETGMRVGDAVSVRPSDIDGHKLTYTAQKTGKSATVRLSGALLRALTASSGGLWVFPSPKDRRRHLTRQAVWHRVKVACKRAGIDPAGVAPHSFRKYFAVELFKREGMLAAQKALQHDRASTTEIYALSDFTSGANAALPLLRRDLGMIIEMVLQALKGRAVPCESL